MQVIFSPSNYGLLVGSTHLLNKYKSTLQSKNHPGCPLCKRSFESDLEVEELIRDVSFLLKKRYFMMNSIIEASSTKQIQPARGWCAKCIHLSRLSGGPATHFFWKASRASPQHGWRSAFSLRETLSPIQDQNQH